MKTRIKTKSNRQPVVRVLFYSLVVAVIVLSLSPHQQPTINISNIDKLQHFTAYFTLAVVGYLFSGNGRVIGGGLFLLGLSLELAQSFVPGRQCSLGDLIANSTGIICGLIITVWFLKKRKKASIED